MASYAIKGRAPSVAAKLAEIAPEFVCISVMTRAELRYGVKRLPASHRLHVVVGRFLQIVRILPWDSACADVYADIRHQLTSAGRPIGQMDMMIAAHAIAADAVLVTNNVRHFAAIAAPLVLANWMSLD